MSTIFSDNFSFIHQGSPTPRLDRDESFRWAWDDESADAVIASNTAHIERSCNLPNLVESVLSDAQGSVLHDLERFQTSGLAFVGGQGSALQMENETLDRPDSMQSGPERMRVENDDTSEEMLNFLELVDELFSSEGTPDPLLSAAPGVDHRAPIVNNRGKHWRLKVAEGKPPVPWKGNQEWALRRQAKEAEFATFMQIQKLPAYLPWRLSQGRACGNIQKVMYMDLCMHEVNSVVHLERRDVSEGLFGIVRFFVPEEGRPAFDAGLVPSNAYVRQQVGGQRANKQVRKWETAGFRERQLNGAALAYEYDPTVYAKQKAQQRHRGAA